MLPVGYSFDVFRVQVARAASFHPNVKSTAQPVEVDAQAMRVPAIAGHAFFLEFSPRRVGTVFSYHFAMLEKNPFMRPRLAKLDAVLRQAQKFLDIKRTQIRKRRGLAP